MVYDKISLLGRTAVPEVDASKTEYQDFGSMEEYLKLLLGASIFAKIYPYVKRLNAVVQSGGVVSKDAVMINSEVKSGSTVGAYRLVTNEDYFLDCC